MNNNKIFQINIQQILHSKAPDSYKKIPHWVISLLSKIICQDELNHYFKKNGHATGVDLMKNAVDFFNITLRLKGEENLPESDHKCIFVSNHPLGGLDGICLAAVLGEKYHKQIIYLVNDILYFIEPLKNIFVPINKHGSQAKKGVIALNNAFASENQILTFPAGLCSRKSKGIISDPEWKKMFITKAMEYQRDILPIYFDAKNSSFFYNLAAIRKRLGIRFNIEMIFLPREMIKAIGSTFTVYFGKPIPWQQFDSSKTPRQWADEIKTHTYNIKSKMFL
ncbi:MAG: 1-acyl-sn-glycerol-3-phosphate acyltransferase [Dysgonamonadaceae bacterium]|jgi:putative hemolysin|nr:1-acyl-sn-glycerol-3-phosphate acyltransferase [Dysgonamonadaceae bacterium]